MTGKPKNYPEDTRAYFIKIWNECGQNPNLVRKTTKWAKSTIYRLATRFGVYKRAYTTKISEAPRRVCPFYLDKNNLTSDELTSNIVAIIKKRGY